MKIHEYQARQLLADAGIPVPPGKMVQSVPEAAAEAKRLFDGGAGIVVVKAQVHAGGRGKAGFVKVCKDAAEAEKAAAFMLSNRMVSPQTPPGGLEVGRLLVAAGVDIAKEYYLAIVTDRARRAAWRSSTSPRRGPTRSSRCRWTRWRASRPTRPGTSPSGSASAASRSRRRPT
jgi:succinyl-CoA synthetase beta subunit